MSKFYTFKKGWISIEADVFPNNPSVGDVFVRGNLTFRFDDEIYPQTTWVITEER